MKQNHFSAIPATNNFGFLRLLFASLVIVGHSFEQTKGGWPSELLERLTGTLDVGEVAVDGFFLISGYLITASYLASHSIWSYLVKRCLRIYPAFIVASLVSMFVFAPLAGGWQLFADYTWREWVKIPIRMLLLSEPWVDGAFANSADLTQQMPLNLPTWTIRWEFICYLLVPALGFIGLLSRRYIFAFIVAAILLVYEYSLYERFHQDIHLSYDAMLRFFSCFGVGSLVYLFRDKIVWQPTLALVAGFMLVAGVTHSDLARHVLILCGGYLMFFFAFNCRLQWLNAVGRTHDISYGVYLFAWPFQIVLILMNPDISPWLLSGITLVYAYMVGWISWTWVERPFMQLKKRWA